MVEVTINGDKRKLEPDLTITDLLAILEMKSPAIAVEINHQLQPRDTHDRTRIKSGDVLEIVTLVGGG